MTISTITRSSTFFPLLCALFSTSVLARHYSSRTAFLPRKNLSTVSSSLSRSSPRFSELDASTFSSERDAQILTEYAASLVIAAQLCRGGSQYYEEDNYYDDRGYGGNNDDYFSNQYGNDSNYNYDDNYFDDRGPSYDDKGDGSRFSVPSFSMPDVIRTGNRKIGLPLLGIGGVLTIFGVSLFFNKTLMRLGNLFFVAGVPMTLGPGRTAGYFFQPKKARATACLAAGVMLVFIGWPIFGIILEAFGLLNLFGNMFPMAMMILKTMPVIGPLLKGNAGGKKNNNNNDRYGGNDRGYDDYDRYQDDRDDRYDGGDNYYNDRYQDDDNNRYY